MTAHELAKKLLEGPDLPVWHPDAEVTEVEIQEFPEEEPFILLP